MHTFSLMRRFDLQLFADGASAGGGEGGGASATGAESAADAGQANPVAKSLEELGVPKKIAEKYRARKAAKAAQETSQESEAEPETDPPAPAQEPKAEAKEQDAAAKTISWEEAIKDPEINKKLQETITARTKNLREAMKDLAPALEVIGRQYGMDFSDMSKADFKAFTKAVTEDDHYYEGKALEMGVDVSTARRIENLEADKRRNDAENAKRQQDKQIQDHYALLRQQADALRKDFPDFDLDAELKNDAFYRMTLPGSGLDVETAYWAVHHKEISEAKQAETARIVSTALSNAVRSGQQMPQENGTNAKAAAGVTNKLYSQMTPEERKIYKAELLTHKRPY